MARIMDPILTILFVLGILGHCFRLFWRSKYLAAYLSISIYSASVYPSTHLSESVNVHRRRNVVNIHIYLHAYKYVCKHMCIHSYE